MKSFFYGGWALYPFTVVWDGGLGHRYWGLYSSEAWWNAVSYTHLDVYKRQVKGADEGAHHAETRTGKNKVSSQVKV